MRLDSDERIAALTAYIEEAKTAPFEWGKSDCCAWAAKWFEIATGETLNLTPYSSKEEALALKKDGLLALWTDVLGDPRQEWEAPEFGDVGIVDTARYGHMGVIFLNDGVAVWRLENGQPFPFRPRNFVAFWSV